MATQASQKLTLQCPLQGPCMFSDCRQPASCSGNRFYIEDGVLHVIWVRTSIV